MPPNDGTAPTAERPRTAGRPRSAAADQAILDAALRLLIEEGYTGLSLEAVAAMAGVGKTTIYRRYRDKRELAAAAVSAFAARVTSVPDTGNTRADLLDLWTRVYTALGGLGLFKMIGTLLVEEERNPLLLERFRELVIGPQRARIRAVLERAVQRGEIRPDVNLDAVVDAVMGSVFARHISGPRPAPEWFAEILDLVWTGIALPASSPNPPTSGE